MPFYPIGVWRDRYIGKGFIFLNLKDQPVLEYL